MKEIKLKYFKQDETKHIDKKAICVVCSKRGIEIGAMVKEGSRIKPQVVCIDCAIRDYAHSHKIKKIEIAKIKRRRMFDISYLLFEILIDEFLKMRGKKTFKNLSEEEMEFNYALSQEIYNTITKKEKEKLENLSQVKIEEIFRNKIKDYFILDNPQIVDSTIISESKSDISQKIITDYIGSHRLLKNDRPTKQEIAQAIKTIENPKIAKKTKKIAILVLAHSGTERALECLEKYYSCADLELKFWIEQAIGECKMFMEE
jgi:hypothetical protein